MQHLKLANLMVVASIVLVALSSTEPNATFLSRLESEISTVSKFYQFRTSGPGAYCNQWYSCPAGLSCVYFRNGPVYGLGSCVSGVSVGHACGNQALQCSKGQCVNGIGGKRCRIEQGLGGNCADTASTYCKHPLRCAPTGYCVAEVGYGHPCDGKHRFCRSQLTCAPSSNGQGSRCHVPIAKGSRCGYKYGLCASGTDCVYYSKYEKKCLGVMGENGSCGGKYMVCLKGLKCVGTGAHAKCISGGGKGDLCNQGRFCNKGLECVLYANKDKRCIKVMDESGDCTGSYMLCRGDLKCTGPSFRRKCVRPVDKGGYCEKSPNTYKVCKKGLSCHSSSSATACFGVMGENGSCAGNFMKCHSGLQCIGTGAAKKCKPYVAKGGLCGDTYGNCQRGLSCVARNGISKCYGIMSYDQKCDGSYMVCGRGLYCRGGASNGHKKCVKPVGKGADCGGEYQYCAKGLTCGTYGSGKKCVGVMGLYGACSGSYMTCAKGLQCIGPQQTERKCVPIGQRGSKCDGRYHRCAKDLHCYKGYCVKIQNRGEDCSTPYSICRPGLPCLSRDGVKKCYRPVPKGYFCNHPQLPYVVCDKGLSCYGSGIQARCSKIVKEYGSCEGSYVYCAKIAGLKCGGVVGSRTCRKLANAGQVCGKVWPKCEKHLICIGKSTDSGLCFKVNGKGESCGDASTLCGPGLFCGSTPSGKQCILYGKLGEKCQLGKFYRKCEHGLKCSDGVCKKELALHIACGEVNTVCTQGSVCAGLPYALQCVLPMKEGARCDDPYWKCESGLVCSSYKGERRCVKRS